MQTVDTDLNHDVIVVGGGAAGIGVAVALRHAGIENFLVLDRHRVGASFECWPTETRFITPSFPTNSVGMLDLNSVAVGVSPGFSLQVEHPSGQEYAQHLRAVAHHYEVPVREDFDVVSVTRLKDGFQVSGLKDSLTARHVIWAGGEFQYPKRMAFAGSELCLHTAMVNSYEDLDGNDFIIIGGFESGIDAAYHLAYGGARVRVFDLGCPWQSTHSDPSIMLSPFTLERLREDWFVEQVELHPYTPIKAVTYNADGYDITTEHGATFHSAATPLWAGGFEGSHLLISELFTLRPDGFPELNEHDESTRTPGLFLCGPAVRHENHIFCFIYKYRQRFAVVAKAIATALGLPAEQLETYRLWGMYLDDLSCCGEECVC